MSSTPDLQNFYTDRHRRGLSDKMIFNELEAAGWPVNGLAERIAEARRVYETLPTSEFMRTNEAVEYDIPNAHQRPGFLRYAYAIITTIAYIYLSYKESEDTFFIWFFLGVALCTVGYMEVKLWIQRRKRIQRVRFDNVGLTVRTPARKLQPWSTFAGYRSGERDLEAAEDSQQKPLLSHLSTWKTKVPKRPVVRFYRAERWIGMRSNVLAYTIDLPPGRESSVLEFIGTHLPLLPSNAASSSTALGWKIFTFGMMFIALLLVGAILYVVV